MGFICDSEYPLYSEPFYSVSIEIKNKKDIMESLKLFITGEMLQGENKFKCDLCDEGRDTLKRCCISVLSFHFRSSFVYYSLTLILLLICDKQRNYPKF